MANASKALSFAQISNVENTVGTAEAATEILLFETFKRIAHDKVFHMPTQDRGHLAANSETPFQVQQLAEFEMEGDLYDRIANFMFSSGIRGNITPAAVGGSETLAYTWAYLMGLTTQNTPDITNGIDTFTLEWGSPIQEYETEYIFTTSIEISGAINEAVRYKWGMQGRGVTESTKTAALSVPTSLQYFPMNKAKWFVDSSYAGIGGTQKSGVLYGFTWKLETNFTARFTADGNYYFSALNEDRKKVELELMLYRDSTIYEAELDKFQAQSTSYQRLALFGTSEIDSGQSNPPYIYLDGAYKYTEWPELDEQGGMDVIKVKAESFYDTTAAKQFGTTVKTAMASFA